MNYLNVIAIRIFPLFFPLCILSCSSNDTGSTQDAGSLTDMGSNDAILTDALASDFASTVSDTGQSYEGLGQDCPMGCNLTVCVKAGNNCKTGYCAWDGRFGLDSYCTVPCEKDCPEGYECIDNQLSSGGKYCLKKKPALPTDVGKSCSGSTPSGDFYPTECVSREDGYYCADHKNQDCQSGICALSPDVSGASLNAYCTQECDRMNPNCPTTFANCAPSPNAGHSEWICF